MSNFAASRMSNDNWATPEKLYKCLDQEFHFNYDPCPLNPNWEYTNSDGLLTEWGTSTYVNPPYSDPEPWCRKAWCESRHGKLIVMLLRGDTSTKWFHDWVLPYAEIRFIKGRLNFNNKGPAPFASIIAIYHPLQKRELNDKEE